MKRLAFLMLLAVALLALVLMPSLASAGGPCCGGGRTGGLFGGPGLFRGGIIHRVFHPFGGRFAGRGCANGQPTANFAAPGGCGCQVAGQCGDSGCPSCSACNAQQTAYAPQAVAATWTYSQPAPVQFAATQENYIPLPTPRFVTAELQPVAALPAPRMAAGDYQPSAVVRQSRMVQKQIKVCDGRSCHYETIWVQE